MLLKILLTLFSFLTVQYNVNSAQSKKEVSFLSEVAEGKELVKKRNLAGCKRLGNIYGWCKWVAFLKVNNNLDKPLQYICSNLSINKKKYQICLGKNNKKSVMPSNNYKTFLLDLNKLVNYSSNNEKPSITLQTISFKLGY